jgi:hypothetical protein
MIAESLVLIRMRPRAAFRLSGFNAVEISCSPPAIALSLDTPIMIKCKLITASTLACQLSLSVTSKTMNRGVSGEMLNPGWHQRRYRVQSVPIDRGRMTLHY